ncbi:hypothetical protein [Pseudoalteromonas xiamenensis]
MAEATVFIFALRYAAIEKQLQKYANKAEEHSVSNSKNSENSWWQKIDFTKPKEKIITLIFTLWTLYLICGENIS